MKANSQGQRGIASLPLAAQILGLLLGGLVVAQAVTLLLTLMLPPEPPQQYRLEDIATTLIDGGSGAGDGRPLIRTVAASLPPMEGPGWLTSETSRRDLARLLGARESDVHIAFYAPLPFGGAIARPPSLEDALPAVKSGFDFLPAKPVRIERGLGGIIGPAGPVPGIPGRGRVIVNRSPGVVVVTPQPDAPPPMGRQRSPSTTRYKSLIWGDPTVQAANSPVRQPIYGPPAPERPASTTATTESPQPERTPAPARDIAVPLAVPADLGRTPSLKAPSVAAASREPDKAPARQSRTTESGPSVAPEPPRALFGFAPAPFVTGDFIAAHRQQDGRWAIVHPRPEPFPNAWQRRVLLWFAIAFALVAPLGWLFARRIVTPLSRFAEAAHQLGRDPTVAIDPLVGPAEIGRAATAFNQMQGRLKRFIDDRTAMIGAISHDLRNPLTRMRFRLEEADDALREGMLEEVAEMEEMITSVLAFLRDAADPGLRETADLRSILENVVDGTMLVGGDVALEPGVRALVEVDATGIRRVLDNLVDNALKYGERARIRLFTRDGEAIADIADDGPGLSPAELDRVFKPFYRGERARGTNMQGIGLGLAACRSIARAHGGDVDLLNTDEGLVARLRLPLAETA